MIKIIVHDVSDRVSDRVIDIEEDKPIRVDINVLKVYLDKLNHLESYYKTNEIDNLSNIKKYFNNNIFISIPDFHEEKYDRICQTNRQLARYLRKNPNRRRNKNIIKKEGHYRIFLRFCQF